MRSRGAAARWDWPSIRRATTSSLPTPTTACGRSTWARTRRLCWCPRLRSWPASPSIALPRFSTVWRSANRATSTGRTPRRTSQSKTWSLSALLTPRDGEFIANYSGSSLSRSQQSFRRLNLSILKSAFIIAFEIALLVPLNILFPLPRSYRSDYRRWTVIRTQNRFRVERV